MNYLLRISTTATLTIDDLLRVSNKIASDSDCGYLVDKCGVKIYSHNGSLHIELPVTIEKALESREEAVEYVRPFIAALNVHASAVLEQLSPHSFSLQGLDFKVR